MEAFEIRTVAHSEFREVTREVQAVVTKSGAKRGHALVYIPHTTAGITINENADPTVRSDMLESLEKMVPWEQPHFKHAEGNSAAHIKASMMGFSATVFIEQAKLVLGTWQGIYLCEFDGPRARKVYVRVVSGA
ncbi:MAG: YjbQ family protein [Planctomycetes bacterium]|nr:YjbQ family protein [Planctomycetota bacterium]